MLLKVQKKVICYEKFQKKFQKKFFKKVKTLKSAQKSSKKSSFPIKSAFKRTLKSTFGSSEPYSLDHLQSQSGKEARLIKTATVLEIPKVMYLPGTSLNQILPTLQRDGEPKSCQSCSARFQLTPPMTNNSLCRIRRLLYVLKLLIALQQRRSII